LQAITRCWRPFRDDVAKEVLLAQRRKQVEADLARGDLVCWCFRRRLIRKTP